MPSAATWQLSPAELQAIASKALKNRGQPDAQKTPPAPHAESPAAPVPAADTASDAFGLAQSYAQTWNDLVAAGMPPSDHEVHEADAELEGSPWRLQQGEDGKWTVVPAQAPVEVRQFARRGFVLQFAAMRAPYGTRSQPFTVSGSQKPYLKGQFIPGEVIKGLKARAEAGDQQAQQQVQELEGAAAGHEATRQKNAQARQQRDLSKLKGRLATHAEGRPLDVAQERTAARTYRALRQHHGNLVAHRLDELSEQVESRLAKVDRDLARTAQDDPSYAGLSAVRARLATQLAVYNRVHQLAEAQTGGQQQSQEAPVQEQPKTEQPAAQAQEPLPTEAKQPRPKSQSQSIDLNDSKALASAIHKVGATVPDAISGNIKKGNLDAWQSHKPLLADVYAKMRPELGGASLQDFKNAVWKAYQNGDLDLSRIDLVQAVKGDRPYERIQESEIAPFGNDLATFHLVNTNSERARKAAGQTQEQPAKQALTTEQPTAESSPLRSHESRLDTPEETKADVLAASIIHNQEQLSGAPLTDAQKENIVNRAEEFYRLTHEFAAKVDAGDPAAVRIVQSAARSGDPLHRHRPDLFYAAEKTGIFADAGRNAEDLAKVRTEQRADSGNTREGPDTAVAGTKEPADHTAMQTPIEQPQTAPEATKEPSEATAPQGDSLHAALAKGPLPYNAMRKALVDSGMTEDQAYEHIQDMRDKRELVQDVGPDGETVYRLNQPQKPVAEPAPSPSAEASKPATPEPEQAAEPPKEAPKSKPAETPTAAREGGVTQKPKPPEKPSAPFNPAAHTDALVRAVGEHGGRHNLAGMSSIRKALAAQGITDRKQQDAVINEGRKKGLVSASAIEGRHGTTPEEREAALSEGESQLGHLSLREPESGWQRATTQPTTPSAETKPAAPPPGKPTTPEPPPTAPKPAIAAPAKDARTLLSERPMSKGDLMSALNIGGKQAQSILDEMKAKGELERAGNDTYRLKQKKAAPGTKKPAARPLLTNPAEIQRQAEEYRASPERLRDLEAFAARREKMGDTAGAQEYRERAAKLKAWLTEHNRLSGEGEEEYNPGKHEREAEASDTGLSRLASDILGKGEAGTGKKAEPTRPIRLDMLSPEARQVVEQEEKNQSAERTGAGRPATKKNKILNAARQLTQMKAQLASHSPMLDEIPEPDEDNPHPEPITRRQRLQELAAETERAIADSDVKALEAMRYAREWALLVFSRSLAAGSDTEIPK